MRSLKLQRETAKAQYKNKGRDYLYNDSYISIGKGNASMINMTFVFPKAKSSPLLSGDLSWNSDLDKGVHVQVIVDFETLEHFIQIKITGMWTIIAFITTEVNIRFMVLMVVAHLLKLITWMCVYQQTGKLGQC